MTTTSTRPPPAPDDTAPPPSSVDETPSVYVAPQWKLVWWRFRKHRVAMISAGVVGLFIFVGLFAEVLSPQRADSVDPDHIYAPPQRLHVIDTSGPGIDLGLYVNGYRSTVNDETLERSYETDPEQKVPVGFFVDGESYELWGLIPMDTHLIGPKDPDDAMFLLGSDRLGRDMVSRLMYGTRISLSIGLAGVALAFVLGIVFGGISGYYGGGVDTAIQRVVEFLMSIPTIPLWLGLSAAVPPGWGPLKTYFAITILLSIVGWTDLARVVRGRFLSLRQEDFVRAAELDGCSKPRIIFRHMLPSFASHVIASLTLAIPFMILAETALSFLGLGLQPPVVSWGVLLQEAQNIRAVATAPWVLAPGIAVATAVLALNFVGDGLRDSADPYA